MQNSLTPELIDREIRPRFSRVLSAHSGSIYLANHSLGRPLDATLTNIRVGAELWADHLDDAWSDEYWMGEMGRYRSLLARLLDLEDASAVVPKTSAGQGLRAVLNSFPVDRPINIVSTRGEFDSADFILKTYAEVGRATVRWSEPTTNDQGVPVIEPSSILDLITADTDLVAVSAVMFGTGQVLKYLDLIIDKAHRNGALVLIDCYHSLGVFPFSMRQLGADFCVGGCYKYLRGGAGSCFLAIAPWILESGRRTLDTGWFAKRDTFSYARPEKPETWSGGDGWLESTVPILTAYQATPGLEFTLEIGVEAIRTRMLELLSSLRLQFENAGIPVVVPRNREEWGAFALVSSNDPAGLSARLKERDVVTDARGGFVRFGPDILTTQDEIDQTTALLKSVV